MNPEEVLDKLLGQVPEGMLPNATVYFVMDMRDKDKKIHLMNAWLRCNDVRGCLSRTFLVEYKENIYPSYLDPVDYSNSLTALLKEKK